MKNFRIGGKAKLGGEEQLFVNALTETFDNKPRDYLRGATASYCPRQNFFNSKKWGFKAKNTATAQVYMGIGNGVEEAICKGLIRENRLLANNFWLPDSDPKVSGKIDLIYLDSDNELALGEIKTCGELPAGKGKAEHISQSETYAAIAGFDRMNLIYVSRNVVDRAGNLLLKVFEIDTSRENMINVLSKIVFSKMAINNNFKPEIPLNFHKTTTCLFCDYQQYCWGDLKDPYKTLSTEETEIFEGSAYEIAIELYDKRFERRLKMFKNLKKDYDKTLSGSKYTVFLPDIINQEITRLEGVLNYEN